MTLGNLLCSLLMIFIVMKIFSTANLTFCHIVTFLKKRQLKRDEIISLWVYTTGSVGYLGHGKKFSWDESFQQQQ